MLQTHHILFNELKHHLSYVRKEINNRTSIEDLLPLILTLGHSKMDMYAGNLSISMLFEETLSQIPSKNAPEFREWINSNNGYRMLQLSDQSEWIVRYATEKPLQFIHLHPGRYSPNTFRVSATILKTAVLTVAALQYDVIDEINTSTINHLRSKYLSQSPIKSLEKSMFLERMIAHLTI